MEVISVIITSIYRPECLEACLGSFRECVIAPNKGVCSFEAVVNVDPWSRKRMKAPGKWELSSILGIVNRYMPLRKARIPSKPSFTKALGWCWSAADTCFIFQLEDDWVFTKSVDMRFLLSLIKTRPDLSGFALDRVEEWSFSPVKRGKDSRIVAGGVESCYLIRNGDVHGPPALLNSAYANKLGRAFFRSNYDTRPKRMGRVDSGVRRILSRWPYMGVYLGKDGRGEFVKDIGRNWQKTKGTKIHKR